MPGPIIGLTTSHDQSTAKLPAVMVLRAYVSAVLEAGGVPMLIPSGLPEERWRILFQHLDGILFTGGGDIAITRYNGIPHPTVKNVDEQRDEIEIALIKAAVAEGKPFLGICRGIQVLNVAMGGSLYTHIQDLHPRAIEHDYRLGHERNYLAHQVGIQVGSRLAKVMG